MAVALETPLRIGTMALRNRLYRAPVLEGAGGEPDPAAAYARHFVANAEAGVGMIVQGSTCITPEGRTSPGMTTAATEAQVHAMAPVVDAVHAAGAAIVLQLGHGGIFAIEGWHEPYASQRTGPLLAASRLPLALRALYRKIPVHPLSTQEVHELADRFGVVAGWARAVGYDAVQLGSANAKLLDQFLSPFYNRRDDEFGGSLEGRARILRVVREAVARHAGDDYPCLVKIPAEKGPPLLPHVGLDDALRMCELAEEWGFDAITPVEVSVFPDTTLSRGGAPSTLRTNPGMKKRLQAAAPSRVRRAVLMAGNELGGRRAPFSPVWNRSLFAAAKQRVSIPVFAVGGIRSREDIDSILGAGQADLVGVGRPFYAEPALASRLLHEPGAHARCKNSNLCVPAQMLGMKGLCYNPEVTRSVRSGER